MCVVRVRIAEAILKVLMTAGLNFCFRLEVRDEDDDS